MELPTNKVIFSAIQPSGVIHIGNYLGALKNWVALQANNTCYFCIVDEHAITVPYEPKELAKNVIAAAALYIAAGINIEKSVMFVQSHVAAHTELGWLLSTIAPFGEMKRMTQFKDKAKKHADSTSLGLFAYPVLMAADILLYKADVVPVGEDQTQHLELTRDLAKKFNTQFGQQFTIPEGFINKDTARIMSLSDPKKKMSKSDAPKSYIALTDTPEDIKSKIASAVTDTEAKFNFKKSGPAVKNLLNIYKAFSEESEEAIEAKFAGKGYGEFKTALADLLIAKLTPIREKYEDLRRDDTELRLHLGRGMHHAQGVANRTLQDAKELMGLL
jgi:tryptophanyl-tRNA synthetase